MSAYSVTEPSKASKWGAGLLVTLYTIITLLPLVWIISTSFKTGPDSISYPPKVFFDPTVEGYVNLFTTRTRPAVSELDTLPPPQGLMEEIARRQGTGESIIILALPVELPGSRPYHHGRIGHPRADHDICPLVECFLDSPGTEVSVGSYHLVG